MQKIPNTNIEITDNQLNEIFKKYIETLTDKKIIDNLEDTKLIIEKEKFVIFYSGFAILKKDHVINKPHLSEFIKNEFNLNIDIKIGYDSDLPF